MQETGNKTNNAQRLTMCIDYEWFTFFTETDGAIEVDTYHVNPSISLTANLREAFVKLDFLNRKYEYTDILTSSPYTLVPLEGFEDEQAQAVYSYTFPSLENRHVMYEVMTHANVVNIFSLDRNARQYLLEQMPDAKFHGWMSSSINYAAWRYRSSANTVLYVQFTDSSTDIVGLRNGRIIFANSFSERSDADRIYYILYTWKQLNMSQTSDLMLVAGAMEGSSAVEQLKKYVANVTNLDTQLAIAKSQDEIPFYFKTLYHESHNWNI